MNAIFTTDDRVKLYRGYEIHPDISGYGYMAYLPHYDGEPCLLAMTVEGVKAEIDMKVAEVAETARLSELAAMLAEDPDNAELLGRRDAHKPMANPDPCDWDAGIPLPDQSDRAQEYLRGYEAELTGKVVA